MPTAARSAPYGVLFLCTGNSARSILGEALLRHHGGGRFAAASAGSDPKGELHPLALELLRERGLDPRGLRSKGLEELLGPGPPPFDLLITVCDHAAETCPVLPGVPATVHWGLPDPATATGPESERRAAFRRACDALEARILRLVALDEAELRSPELAARLAELHAALD